jgi:hypothetical protein
VLAADRVYAPLVHCDPHTPVAPPFLFVVDLPDIKGATTIVFRRGHEEVYRRNAPAREPVLRNFRAESNKPDRTAILSWNFERATEIEPRFWLQASADGGKTWRGVVVGLRGERAEVDLNALPGGEIILRLLGHDGFHTATATTTVNLPPAAREAVILHPRDGAVIVVCVKFSKRRSGRSWKKGKAYSQTLRQGEVAAAGAPQAQSSGAGAQPEQPVCE